MILNSDNLEQEKNSKNTDNHLIWDLFENLDRETIQKNDKIWSLKQSLQYLFWWDSFLDYHEFTKKEIESGRWAWLYTIIKYDNEDTLVYIWSWEFNTEMFNKWWIAELKWLYKSPLPLFIISQTNTFDLERNWINTNIKDYLNENSIIVVPWKWEAYINSYWSKKNQVNFNNINIRHLKDAIKKVRLAILQKEFPNWQFQECIKIIEKLQEMDFEKFYNTIYKNEQYLDENRKKLLWCFWNMWVNRVWSWVWDKKAYKSLYDLIISFNLQQQSF